MKIIFSVMLLVLTISCENVFAMRCGTHLINEGDSVTRMLQLCGTPTRNTYSDIVYMNKDGDGMNYYIHIDPAGMVDRISMSRGGL